MSDSINPRTGLAGDGYLTGRVLGDDVDEHALITREELDALKAGMWREIHRRQKRSARIRQGVRPVVAAIVGAIAFVALSNDGGSVRRMDPDPLLGGGEDVFSETDSLVFLVQPDSTGTEATTTFTAERAPR